MGLWAGTHAKWRTSLAFRLAGTINLMAVVVLIASWGWDYTRERRVHLGEGIGRLREEANVLRVAQQELPQAGAFQRYVDSYCRQMGRDVSPGHHILVTNAGGRALVRAHQHHDPGLESQMALVKGDGARTFTHAGEEYLVVGVGAPEGSTILVAQAMAPMERLIRRQAISRAVSMTVLVVIIVVVTDLVLLRWVQRPILSLVRGVDTIRAGHFGHAIEAQNTTEFQFLADGFNRMSASLAENDLRRRLEMSKARRIHLGLLPAEPIAVPGLTVVARYIPADSIGGDYHDILRCPDGRWLFIVADVAGHGVPPAIVSAMLKALVRQAVRHENNLASILHTLNGELALLTGVEFFVTCLMARYDAESGALEYGNCGHVAGVVVGPTGEVVATLDSTGLPLGIDAKATWPIHTARLSRGESLHLLTDGLFEVYGADETSLGWQGLAQLIRKTAMAPPAQQAEAIIEHIREFRGGTPSTDDVTLVILKRDL